MHKTSKSIHITIKALLCSPKLHPTKITASAEN